MTGFHTFWTIALVVIFVLIARWAWSSKQSKAFQEAANLPWDDPSQELSDDVNKGKPR